MGKGGGVREVGKGLLGRDWDGGRVVRVMVVDVKYP